MFTHDIMLLFIIGWTFFCLILLLIAHHYDKTDNPAKIEPKLSKINVTQIPKPTSNQSNMQMASNPQIEYKMMVTTENNISDYNRQSRLQKNNKQKQLSSFQMDQAQNETFKQEKSDAQSSQYKNRYIDQNQNNLTPRSSVTQKRQNTIKLPNGQILSTFHIKNNRQKKHYTYISHPNNVEQKPEEIPNVIEQNQNFDTKSNDGFSPRYKTGKQLKSRPSKRFDFQQQKTEQPDEHKEQHNDIQKCHQISRIMEKRKQNLSRYFQILLIYFRNIITLDIIIIMLKYNIEDITFHLIYLTALFSELFLRFFDFTMIKTIKHKPDPLRYQIFYYVLWTITFGILIYLLIDSGFSDVYCLILYSPAIGMDLLVLDPLKYCYKKKIISRIDEYHQQQQGNKVNVLKILNAIK